MDHLVQVRPQLAYASVILEDVCENEQSGVHLVGGVKVAPEMLAKYAGTYEFAPGRQAVVTDSGDRCSSRTVLIRQTGCSWRARRPFFCPVWARPPLNSSRMRRGMLPI